MIDQLTILKSKDIAPKNELYIEQETPSEFTISVLEDGAFDDSNFASIKISFEDARKIIEWLVPKVY